MYIFVPQMPHTVISTRVSHATHSRVVSYVPRTSHVRCATHHSNCTKDLSTNLGISESWCIRNSHVTYEDVMSRTMVQMKESRRIWRSHVTYEGVMSNLPHTTHVAVGVNLLVVCTKCIRKSHVTHEGIM